MFSELDVGCNNERIRKEFIEKTISSIEAGSKILDAGAGELSNKVYCQHLEYYSQDICQYDGVGNESGLQTGDWNTKKIDIVSDIINIPCDSESFDAVLCSEVLEHVLEPDKAIDELLRLLKPGGLLIITAPFNSLTHFAPYHYSTGFNRYFYEKVFDGKVIELDITPNGNYFEYIAQEVRRVESINGLYSKNKGSIFGKFLFKFSKKILLKYLSACSLSDQGSSELLNFGFNVVARKSK